jgi:hypothetical protein
VVSPTELRMRRLLADKPHVGSFVVSTLLRLNEWTASIQTGQAEIVLWRKLEAPATASDPIEQFAENLVEPTTGIERQLLSKSVQEALFYCVGFDTDLTSTQIKGRLKRFLDSQNRFAFIQRFLSCYFFNYVWFHTGELFRAEALTTQVFEKNLEEVENICQRAIDSALEPHEQLARERALDQSAAEELIRDIEQRLCGV